MILGEHIMSITVKPQDIEKELDRLSEEYKQKNKFRACLFNLIVYVKDPHKVSHFQKLADQVMNQFPCRVLFIEEIESSGDLVTAVSAKMIGNLDNKVHCDEIYLKVPSDQLEKIPFILLPHILPDLPVYLLWGEDPTKMHSLLQELKSFSKRLIFDSDCANQLPEFAKKISYEIEQKHLDIADLNWVRLEGWREVLKNVFNSEDKIADLHQSQDIHITYNLSGTEKWCHPSIQAHYLHAWLAAQLNWTYTEIKNTQKCTQIIYQKPQDQVNVFIHAIENQQISSGSILKVYIQTESGSEITLDHQTEGHVRLIICSKEKCDLPFGAYLAHAKWEYSFAREICYKETSFHYTNMLKVLSRIKGNL